MGNIWRHDGIILIELVAVLEGAPPYTDPARYSYSPELTNTKKNVS
jgi:hypothetical protein